MPRKWWVQTDSQGSGMSKCPEVKCILLGPVLEEAPEAHQLGAGDVLTFKAPRARDEALALSPGTPRR